MKIAFIGLGEAASAFISGWGAERSGAIRAFDIKSLDALTADEIADRATALGVKACTGPEDALEGAAFVFSTVTADQALAAAEDYCRHLEPDAVWCDLNSCAPRTKQAAARTVEAHGARYLDVAVMAPVAGQLNMVPCLLSGPCASELLPMLKALPMNIRVVGDEVGRASSIKLVRSIMVKGLEALTAECALAAAAAGVAEEVFPSLSEGHPKIDVAERAAYNFERMAVHGQRRAAEMDACAQMLEDLGLFNGMALGSAEWQRRLSQASIAIPDGAEPDWTWFTERLLAGESMKDEA